MVIWARWTWTWRRWWCSLYQNTIMEIQWNARQFPPAWLGVQIGRQSLKAMYRSRYIDHIANHGQKDQGRTYVLYWEPVLWRQYFGINNIYHWSNIISVVPNSSNVCPDPAGFIRKMKKSNGKRNHGWQQQPYSSAAASIFRLMCRSEKACLPLSRMIVLKTCNTLFWGCILRHTILRGQALEYQKDVGVIVPQLELGKHCITKNMSQWK